MWINFLSMLFVVLVLTPATEAGTRSLSEGHALVKAIDQNRSDQVVVWLDRGFGPQTRIKNKLKERLIDRSASVGAARVFELFLVELKKESRTQKLKDSRGTPLIVTLTAMASAKKEKKEIYEAMVASLLRHFPESVHDRDRAYLGDGRRAVHQAAAIGNLKLLKLFHQHGADMNAVNDAGETPLHLAARFGHVDVVKYLVSIRVNVDKRTRHTKATALMSAAEAGQEMVIRVLMAYGANKHVRDTFGKTPPERYYDLVNHRKPTTLPARAKGAKL